jgi:hypothetical protein
MTDDQQKKLSSAVYRVRCARREAHNLWLARTKANDQLSIAQLEVEGANAELQSLIDEVTEPAVL